MQFLKDTKIDFLGKRNAAFIVSSLLVVLSLVFLFIKAPNWGIDFTGGSLIHLKFEGPMPTKTLRDILSTGGIEEISIQQFRNTKVVILRIKKAYGESEIVDKVQAALEKGAPELKYEVLRNEMVGPAVGSYLREKAVKAFLFAFVGMIIYIAWRFKGGIWGFAAVLALVHDVIITFGILNYMGITIDLPVIAALLTLAGYSINDSIVIYDRIRENMRIHYKKRIGEIINLSINSTLSRTMITSGTTIAVVIALFLKGGEVLHGFSTALMFGIVIGTYSSVFVAAPLVYVWQNKK
ncbi:MAG: protein translocase subunit SecF [Elusimicrobiota bacterium]